MRTCGVQNITQQGGALAATCCHRLRRPAWHFCLCVPFVPHASLHPSSSSVQLSPSSHRPGVGDRTRDPTHICDRLQCLFCADTKAMSDVLAPQVLARLRRREAADVRGIFSNTLFIWRPFPVCRVYIRPSGTRRRGCSCATGCTASADSALGRCRNRCAMHTIDRIKARRTYKCHREANATPDRDLENILGYIDNSCLVVKLQ